jgi:small subunit ribosomal protein S4
VQDGDVVQVDPKKKDMQLVFEGQESSERDLPDYIEVDQNDLKATFQRGPKLADVPYPTTMEPNLVIEYYSR